MTLFFSQLRCSLKALLAAWVACNLAWWLGALPALIGFGTEVWQPKNWVPLALLFGLHSGVVLLGVGVLLILPMDWILGWDGSRLGARGGFLAALPFAGFWVAVSLVLSHQEPPPAGGPGAGFKGEVFLGTLPYVLATLAAGTVFGWARARFAAVPQGHTAIALKALPLLLLAGSLPGQSPANEPAARARPNILFIIADDLAARLGSY
jgi:hypothetical protein